MAKSSFNICFKHQIEKEIMKMIHTAIRNKQKIKKSGPKALKPF